MAEPTYNEQLLDAMIAHQVGLLRYTGGLRNKIWKLLDATEADLKTQLQGAEAAGFDSPARVRRLNRVLEGLRETRLNAWREVRKEWRSELTSLAVAEAGFFDGVLATVIPVELGTTVPEAQRLRRIATSTPFQGRTLSEWGKKMQADDLARIETSVKVGLVQGESVQQISRRLVGTVSRGGAGGATAATRHQVNSLARTVSSGVASESRRAFLEENADIAPEWIFLATLDSRTTPICRGFDGKVFKVGEGPRLPLHFGERSGDAPIIDGEVIGDRPRRDFTEQNLVREYARENGINIKVPSSDSARAARNRLPRGTKGDFDSFARKRMRELTGTTPAKTSYQDWLSRRPAIEQDDILGPTRGKLFRRGDLKLDRFTDRSGSELTLQQLAKQHADAFEAAGLDPSDYL